MSRPPPPPYQSLCDNSIVAALPDDEAAALANYLEVVTAVPGEVVVREGDPGRHMYFVLDGRARIERGGMRLQEVHPGDHFGEIALLSERPRAASIVATEPLVLARLSRERWDRMSNEHPALALCMLRQLVGGLGAQLAHVTDDVGVLLRERSLPRRTQVTIRVGDRTLPLATGTPVGTVLPARVDGALVVAALVDRKPVALNTPLAADAVVEPLSTRSWEGREVYRRSAGLLLLTAARKVAPDVAVRIGPSLSSAQLVELPPGADAPALAELILAEMRAIAKKDPAFVEEMWTVEEAISHFASSGWEDGAKLLHTWRDPTVPLVTCGGVYALSFAPLLPSAGVLEDLGLRPYYGGLLLEFGEAVVSMLPAGAREVGDPAMERGGPARSPDMVVDHRAWLATLGVTSVGAFNERCISGRVSEIIRASEGFHEKRIGKIADLVHARGSALRIICIAGPSSSGKTTFIKRLTVQLQINGITPRAISLDDYYVDREKTVRDAAGEYDFEALEALDLALLQRQLGALLRGETVRTAKYDFLTGKSLPDGGPELTLGGGDVLMLEGIHGLNPKLLGDIAGPDRVFRIFIHPVMGLSFDRLSSVSTADIRLLRRIVRDRHARGYKAADNILRWPSVRDGERRHIFPFLPEADVVFDTSLAYEPSVLKVYADRYLLEVPREHPGYTTAFRLRRLIDRFVTIYPDHVPPTSILREFIGGSGFEY